MADSALHDLFLIAESTYGTTPASDPAFVKVRHTGTTLGLTKDSFQSEELRADRQISDFRHGVKSVGGDVSIELSYGSFDELLEAVTLGTWATNVLKAGTTRRSFSFLRHFSDLASGDKPYHLFSGVEMNTLNLTIPASGMVTGSFGALGKGQTVLSDLTSLGTPTFGAATTTSPFDGFSGSIQEGGSAIGVVTEVSLTLENGLAERNVVGSDETLLPSIGRSNLTGNATVFFEDAVMLEKFLNETESSLQLTLLDAAGNDYEILIPRIKYSGGQPDVSGQGAITLSMPFQALYDTTTGTNIQITRTDA